MPQAVPEFAHLVRLFRSVCSLAEKNYDATRFAEAASVALTSVSDATLDDISCWIAEVNDLPKQNDAVDGFGEPPITILQTGTVAIDVLFWRRGRTSIHQHSFTGAFCVLRGSSIHCTYDFVPSELIEERFVLGDVNCQMSELLNENDVRSIQPGDGLIHGLFHVESPTITLVVRRQEPSYLPQYSYLRPHVAIDFCGTDVVNRRCEVIRTLAHDLARCERFISHCCRFAGPYLRFRYLLSACAHLSPILIRQYVEANFAEYSHNVRARLEAVLIMSSADARALEEIDHIPDFRSRLEKVCSLMIEDEAIAKRTIQSLAGCRST